MGVEEPIEGVRGLPEPEMVRGLFDWLAPSYDRAVVGYSLGQDLRWKSTLLRRLAPRRGERALDVACGTGLIGSRLVRALGSARVVGVDLNRAMLREGRAADTSAQFVRGNATRLPFRDASFDVVTAGYLLKYVPLRRFLSEVARILRPGGRFGGYDFSAPVRRTAAGRLSDLYLRHGLPVVGRWFHRDEHRWEELFVFLGRVASTSGWEDRAEDDARAAGLEQIRRVPSIGGIVTWLWAAKPGAGP
jgi:demethylmenaquinone methyltransferase / 2-methoxy-6-polyprenyl-1,4-benzoquinol methylase